MHLLLILAFILVISVVRALTAPFRCGFGGRRRFVGYNPYRYGCRRHHGLLGRLLPIVALVALDRMFGPRF